MARDGFSSTMQDLWLHLGTQASPLEGAASEVGPLAF